MKRTLERIRLRLASDLPLVPVLTVVFVGVSIITYLAYDHMRSALEELAQVHMVQSLDFLDFAVDVQVQDMIGQTRMISQEEALRLALEDSFLGASARRSALRKLEGYAKDGAFDRFYLMNAAGKIVLASNPALVHTLHLSDRAYYIEAMKGRPYLQTIPVSRVTSRPSIVSSFPIRDENKNVCGALLGIRDIENLAKSMLGAATIKKTGMAFIMDDEGDILALPQGTEKDVFLKKHASIALYLGTGPREVVRYSSHGTERFLATKKNALTGWILAVEADEAEILAPVTHLAGIGSGVSVLTLALVAIALGALRKVMVNLRNSEADQRTLTELSPVGIVRFSPLGKPAYMNRQARTILEIGADAPLPDAICFDGEDASPFDPALKNQRTILGKLAWSSFPSGSRKALLINAGPLFTPGESSRGFIATLEDATERVRTHEALQASEEKFRSIVESSPMGMFFFILNQENELILSDANAASDRMLGVNHREILGRKLEEAFPRLKDTDLPNLYRKVALGEIGRRQFEIAYQDERFSGTYEVIVFRSGERSATTFYLDITERKRSEEERRQSQERFSKLFRLSPEAITLLNTEPEAITDVNEAFCALTGYAAEEALGRTVMDIGLFADAAVWQGFYEILAKEGFLENKEFDGRRKDGASFIGSFSGQRIEIGNSSWLIVMIRDITEIKKMQEMMLQTEKMISVGGIAAGVAHEINNPLGIVLQAVQNIIQRTRVDFPKNREAAEKCGTDMETVASYLKVRKIDQFVQDIKSAAMRAAGIIRHMLDFSRRSESRRTKCHLTAIIERAIVLAASDYDLKKSYDFKVIDIKREYEDNLPMVDCTETELEQVFLNLLRNAAQALASASPPVERPVIAIRAKKRVDGVRIEIEDNGPGIPEGIQRRIFEPFFTTKPPGVGTGLGLSVSYFIVTKGHGGMMEVASTPGKGALFSLTLPQTMDMES